MPPQVISTSISKKEEALTRLGADHFLISTDEEAMKAAVASLDAIVDTVSAVHDVDKVRRGMSPILRFSFLEGYLFFFKVFLGGGVGDGTEFFIDGFGVQFFYDVEYVPGSRGHFHLFVAFPIPL